MPHIFRRPQQVLVLFTRILWICRRLQDEKTTKTNARDPPCERLERKCRLLQAQGFAAFSGSNGQYFWSAKRTWIPYTDPGRARKITPMQNPMPSLDTPLLSSTLTVAQMSPGQNSLLSITIIVGTIRRLGALHATLNSMKAFKARHERASLLGGRSGRRAPPTTTAALAAGFSEQAANGGLSLHERADFAQNLATGTSCRTTFLPSFIGTCLMVFLSLGKSGLL